MADEVFDIAKSYFSLSNQLPDKINKDDTITTGLLFPNFSGFNTMTGPYNPDQAQHSGQSSMVAVN